MTDLWSFLLQTLSLCLTALILLGAKALFRDKLSPRWQYGIWGLLALRALIPVGTFGWDRTVHLRWALERLRLPIELRLSSAFCSPYAPIRVRSPLPWLTGQPVSATDWLFVLWCAGALGLLIWFLGSYLRLRLALRRGRPAGPERLDQLHRAAERYGLSTCQAVEVPGLPSAFLCGVVRPVLVLPEGVPVDDKVLLHELLHLRHWDPAVGAALCLLRCLHWCDPLIWWCCDQIQNDCEAICDQRVLERLKGEERRDYGRILLSMVNERYPRAPGTSSMANGGQNIKRRIQCIARFRRYPQGMALGASCVALVLGAGCLLGSPAQAQAAERSAVPPGLDAGRAEGLAYVHTHRPSTPAGALDTYAKGVTSRNGIWVAMATDPADLSGLLEQLPEGRWDLPDALADGAPSGTMDWRIWDLRKGADGVWSGLLCVQSGDWSAWAAAGNGAVTPYVQSVALTQDRDGWYISPRSAFRPEPELFNIAYPDDALPPVHFVGGDGAYRVELSYQQVLGIDNTADSGSGFFQTSTFLTLPQPDAPFQTIWTSSAAKVTSNGQALRGTLTYAVLDRTAPSARAFDKALDKDWLASADYPSTIGETGSGGTTDLNGLEDWAFPAAFAVSFQDGGTEHRILLAEQEG
ncbi:M56 family metallopeptidase [Pseudoflavonifractor sp. MSJ-37]|uniref:M56 family metallopeptidase n=1 Tax=Pseudoflavonifractor sp. MSJ-37 TaxID=2841531 RepID=UPI001C110811|nr:M56 family metallopeptidase [Pseudoflavonifractor sp. MSJ-37]MBU5435815.1 M56 family metallopeptidase [Pseudoflavonifractor sp. MSJ-37]